jgi:hypothetical protein
VASGKTARDGWPSATCRVLEIKAMIQLHQVIFIHRLLKYDAWNQKPKNMFLTFRASEWYSLTRSHRNK